MVQVCGGGWGKRAGGAGGKCNSILGGEQGGDSPGTDWLTMESLTGGPKGPQCGKGHKGRNQPGTRRPGASAASSDSPVHMPCSGGLPPDPRHCHA